MPQLDRSFSYLTSKGDGDKFPAEHGAYHAYVCWMEDGIKHERSFSVDELVVHIEDFKARGKPTAILEDALNRLRRLNR
jgi:hypothetical protein